MTACEALRKYNTKWETDNYETVKLYRKATDKRTAQYGCRLQDHVLALLGYPGLKLLKRISPKGMAWVNWMIS